MKPLVIGNGSAYFVKIFAEDMGLDFPVYTDPSRATFKALGFRRDLAEIFSFDLVRNSRRAMSKGFRQTSTQGDALQLGGLVLVRADGSVPWIYRSRVAGDHPPVTQILEACRAI